VEQRLQVQLKEDGSSSIYECDGASQNPRLSDADFMCKIRVMQMWICHPIEKLSDSVAFGFGIRQIASSIKTELD